MAVGRGGVRPVAQQQGTHFGPGGHRGKNQRWKEPGHVTANTLFSIV